MKRLLVIDALNAFLRAYIVNPSLSSNGSPIGGLMGFLKILQKLTRETKPDAIIVCWDGAGGSQKRKTLNKNYKAGRKPIRLNRNIRLMGEEAELTNKVWQQTRLAEMLNETPTIQFMFDGIEADDIISQVVQHPHYSEWQKVIFSADKDFYQLCNDKTIIYRPPHRSGLPPQIMNSNRIVEDYSIHPTNFALARAIVGDKSDNLEGVPAVGMPTVAKRLPFLSENKMFTIDEVVAHCAAAENPLKAHLNIIENRDLILHNYKMMQLYSPAISIQSKQQIAETLTNFKPYFNKTAVQAMMIEDGFGVYDWSTLFATFKRFTFEK